MPKSRPIILVLVLILSGLAPAAICQTYRNIAFNRGDVRAPGYGFPHASSNSEYPCIYPADTTNGNHCVPDTTFLALSAINGDTLNTSHGSLTYASWGPQLTVPGLWWKVDFGHDVTVDKVKIWLRADWSGGHDSYWKRATLVFTNGTRDTITIDSLKTGQEFAFTSRTTQSITITDLVASNPAKWCAFTEVQVWGYDPATSVTSPLSAAHLGAAAPPSALCLLPGVSSYRMRVPAGTARVELYSVLGKKVWEHVCQPQTSSMLFDLPGKLPQGVFQARYVKDRN
jgi:hypothetical protein